MKVAVKENRKLIIINSQNTQNENEVETIELIVPTKYEDWNKKIAFVTNDKVIWGLFDNNLYQIPSSVTQYKKLKFYIWMTKDDKDFRSEEKILILNENHPVTGEVTPKDKSDIEQVIDTLEAEIDKVENIDITAQKIGNTATITITDKTGNETSVNIYDGEDGQDGKDGKDGKDGETGATGPAGRGILSITKTSTSGLVDTYTINYTSGSPTTYTVTNGAKGDKGNPGQNGQDGKDGANGKDGYTPVRGTDYWTASDISAIETYCANYIDANITQVLGGSF